MSTPISTYNGPANFSNLTVTGLINGIKVYRALLTGHPGLALTATVLENSLGGTPTFSFIGSGPYANGTQMTLVNAFPQGKTMIRLASTTDTTEAGTDPYDFTIAVWVDASNINLLSWNSNNSQSNDNWMRNCPIEILVYP